MMMFDLLLCWAPLRRLPTEGELVPAAGCLTLLLLLAEGEDEEW